MISACWPKSSQYCGVARSSRKPLAVDWTLSISSKSGNVPLPLSGCFWIGSANRLRLSGSSMTFSGAPTALDSSNLERRTF